MDDERIHPETGKKLTRDVRPFEVRYKGRSRIVNLPGWYPDEPDGEGILVGDDMEAGDRALAELKRLADISGSH